MKTIALLYALDLCAIVIYIDFFEFFSHQPSFSNLLTISNAPFLFVFDEAKIDIYTRLIRKALAHSSLSDYLGYRDPTFHILYGC